MLFLSAPQIAVLVANFKQEVTAACKSPEKTKNLDILALGQLLVDLLGGAQSVRCEQPSPSSPFSLSSARSGVLQVCEGPHLYERYVDRGAKAAGLTQHPAYAHVLTRVSVLYQAGGSHPAASLGS